MKELTLSHRYDLFKDTLSHLGTFLLTETKEDIEYHVFEEFDSDSVSFLHETNLRDLLDGGFINAEICSEALRLSDAFRALEGTALWNSDDVICSTAWREVLELADSVKAMLPSL